MGKEQTDGKCSVPAHIKEKVIGTNINPQTLLATDYLNHFNEIVMLLEMVPDMPELLEECKQWKPKNYCEHFVQSSLSDGEIAAEVYSYVPVQYKKPFEDTVMQLNFLVVQSIERLQVAIDKDDSDRLQHWSHASVRAMQSFMDVCSGIIHGSQNTLQQDQVDDVLGF